VAQEEAAEAEVEESAVEEAAVEEATADEAAEEAAPEPQMSFDEVVEFTPGEQITLDVVVGEVEVRAIEFLVKEPKSGFISNPFSSGNSDLQAELTVRANLATDAEKKRKIGILVELLDGDENVIDRAGNNISFKDNSKIFTFKHTTLKWALERVEKVRLSIEARN
jgi:hypothetical protein